jgi:4-diphosphocytidyl-2-C-methyl-D-erythritol kinase
MIFFPNCKINIGLNICEKLPNGYHNLESVFYPIPWCDILEIIPSNEEEFLIAGNEINCSITQNLCYKAYSVLKEKYQISSVKLFLYKSIPSGAGLGGGSSDAAFTILGLNEIFSLKLSDDQLREVAGSLGSDCSFFIKNDSSYVTGTGNIMNKFELALKGLSLILVKPSVDISTEEAYKHVIPTGYSGSLPELVQMPVSQWKNNIKNDFESALFPIYPELAEIKNQLYESGALYASMSGSGSALYGIFDKEIPTFHFPGSIVRKFKF